MRLFIAIRFSQETGSKLTGLRDEVRLHSQRGRFTTAENLHLTLVFLGECDERQTAAVRSVLDEVRFDPFPIIIDRVGRFQRNRRDIWWAGVGENEALQALQLDLTERLLRAGFSLEQRTYRPHITLGRDILTNFPPWTIQPLVDRVHTVELMKSEQVEGTLTYTPIYSKPGNAGQRGTKLQNNDSKDLSDS